MASGADVGHGVALVATSSATVTNSTFSGNTRGLNLAATSSATVTNSTFSSNTYGLYFGQGGSATVTNSTFHSNTNAGLLFLFSGGSATVTNSTFSGTGFAGLSFAGGGSATLTNTLLATSGSVNCFFNSRRHHHQRRAQPGYRHQLRPRQRQWQSVQHLGRSRPQRLAEQRWPDPDHRAAADEPRHKRWECQPSCRKQGTGRREAARLGRARSTAVVDQRGTSRPQGSGCDIGAYELLGGPNPRGPLGGPGRRPGPGGARGKGTETAAGTNIRGPAAGGGPTATSPTTSTPNLAQLTGSYFAAAEEPTANLTVTAATAVAASAVTCRAPAAGRSCTTWARSSRSAPTPPAARPSPAGRSTGSAPGWANPLTITMDADHTVQATFAPTKAFGDVPANRDDAAAIGELATRGTIRGYNASSYGPDDGVQRAQMAALIARATTGTAPAGHTLTPPACLVAGTWDCEDWGNSFTDQSGDPNLWRNAGTLQHYGVALGYQPGDCAAKGRAFPCYGPSDAVTYAETITFITRAMVAKGYWVLQPNAPRSPTRGSRRSSRRSWRPTISTRRGRAGSPRPRRTGAAGPRAAGSRGRCGRRSTPTGPPTAPCPMAATPGASPPNAAVVEALPTSTTEQRQRARRHCPAALATSAS